ncbi:MAG: hypothetical protein K6G60_02495 [Lachnospiraceae bacterium]|nr:hypothetical protein [Lachnospiraceae bacterium]
MAEQRAIKIKQRKEVNIGIVIFLFVLVYLTINVFVPFGKREISIYEVPLGQLYSKETFKGLIVREEEVYTTDSTGYINYYFKEGDKISKNESVYSIGTDSSVYDRLSTAKEGIKLSSDEISDLKYFINKTYLNASDFKDYESVHDDILNYYRRTMDRKVMVRLNEIISVTGLNSGFNIVDSSSSGIISYFIDAYSNVNTSNFNPSMFSGDYKSEYTYKMDMFDKGSIVYKLITSDEWNIIVEINNEMFAKLSTGSKVTFTIDGEQKLTAPVTFMRCDDKYYAILKLDRYVSNYTTERFVGISFDTEENIGLKIPVTSLAYKDYYRIPVDYFMTVKEKDGSEKKGLVVVRNDGKGEKSYGFLETEIFWKDNVFYYISTDLISSGEYITKPDKTEDTMLYTFTVKLEGAYNINNGYAVFRRIERMDSDKDYVLVKRNSAAGLNAFDHIALNAFNVVEGAVIY